MENTTLTAEAVDEALEKLDEDFAEDIEEFEEEEAEEETEDELVYDEDGNVDIPEDDEGDEEAIADDADKGEGEKEPETAKATETDKTHEKLIAQAKDTLERLGYKATNDEEIIAALVTLAAETEDKTAEEYLKEKAERDELEAARELIRKQKAEESEKAHREQTAAIRKADLEMLHKFCPETSEYTDIEQLPNFEKFRVMRQMTVNENGKVRNMSAVEAYHASHSEQIREAAARGGKNLASTKSHLRPSAPSGAKDDSAYISKAEMAGFREMFGNMSDEDIKKYYNKVTRKE